MTQNRVIVLVDMDCFYVQVEQRIFPELKGKPCAVVQYNTWKGGGIIAVSYEARAHGVNRRIRGDEAKEKCPDINLIHVPELRGKADLTRYREAGAEVIKVLCRFSNCVERASIDEAYIDLTETVHERTQAGTDRIKQDMLSNTHVIGFEELNNHEVTHKGETCEEGVAEPATENHAKPKATTDEQRKLGVSSWLACIYDNDEADGSHDQMLAAAAAIVEEIREAVWKDTGFRCSAGIAHNKVLAKLACGVNKPNKQTILPHRSVGGLFKDLPVHKLRSLGGKLGEQVVDQLGVQFMGEICAFTRKHLQSTLGDKYGAWLYDACRGIEQEPVTARLLPKSIGCGKNFSGKTALNTYDQVAHWVHQLCQELVERLTKDEETNNRHASSLTVSALLQEGAGGARVSRATPIYRSPAIANISMSASKFSDLGAAGTVSIGSFLVPKASLTADAARPAAGKAGEDGARGRVAGKRLGEKEPTRDITTFFTQAPTRGAGGERVGVAADTSGAVAVDASGAIAVDTSGVVAADTSGGVAVDASGAIAVDTSGVAAADTSGGIAVDTSGAVAMDMSGVVAVDMSGVVAMNTSGAVATDTSGVVAADMSGVIAADTSRVVATDTSGVADDDVHGGGCGDAASRDREPPAVAITSLPSTQLRKLGAEVKPTNTAAGAGFSKSPSKRHDGVSFFKQKQLDILMGKECTQGTKDVAQSTSNASLVSFANSFSQRSLLPSDGKSLADGSLFTTTQQGSTSFNDSPIIEHQRCEILEREKVGVEPDTSEQEKTRAFRNSNSDDLFSEEEADKSGNLPPIHANPDRGIDDERVAMESPEICAELVPCALCDRMISPFDLPEHNDYHFALELQRRCPSPAGQRASVAAPRERGKRTAATRDEKSRKKARLAAAATAASSNTKTLRDFFKPGPGS
ncbi:PREDICTED: DNA polymerase eta-like isoform X2 [Priapulus caudatus]|uniref:DNA polymerase eta n=1 Tax=Priapulus caudatus TaxID=37621 RepID=A0ABM1DRE8_PRICU|nr:PREDICTED: DNA polymerase eta-like isoform X2 [Priapulus caudatus]